MPGEGGASGVGYAQWGRQPGSVYLGDQKVAVADTLTIHRLGLFQELGRAFKTTNSIEILNALVAQSRRAGR